MRELLVQVCWSMSMAGSMSLAGSSLVCLSICVGQPRSLETRSSACACDSYGDKTGGARGRGKNDGKEEGEREETEGAVLW